MTHSGGGGVSFRVMRVLAAANEITIQTKEELGNPDGKSFARLRADGLTGGGTDHDSILAAIAEPLC